MEKISVYVLDYDEFDKLVHEHFPQRADYEFAAEQESPNDVDYLTTGIGEPSKYGSRLSEKEKAKRAQEEINDFEEWLTKEKFTGVGRYQILEALCRKGAIPPGNYLIRVSW